MLERKLIIIIFLCLAQITYQQNTPRTLQSYTTDPQRTNTVKTRCGGQSRSDLLDFAQNFDRSTVENAMTSIWSSFEHQPFIKKLLNGTFEADDAGQFARENTGSIVVSLGFFFIPIIIMIFLVPSLICCCCCPDSCPVSECCRKNPAQEYTYSQYCCPAVWILLFSLFVMVAGIIGLLWRQKIQTTYDDLRCSVAIGFDDLINGNVTDDGNSFFIGIQTLGKQLTKFNNNLASIQNDIEEISSSGSKISQIYTDIDNAKVQVQNIPTGSGGALTLEYDSPLNQDSATGTIASTFPAALGDKDTAGTFVFRKYNELTVTRASLEVVSLSADGFQNGISNFSSGVDSAITTVNDAADDFTRSDEETDKTLQNIQNSIVVIAVIVVYVMLGAFVLFGLIVFIAAMCMFCCGKSGCRCLLYFGCSFLVFFGLLSFILAIVFAVVTPISHFSCTYIESGLSSNTEFKDKFSPLITDTQALDYISTCLPTSSGDILQQVLGTDVFDLLTDLRSVINNLNSFSAQPIVDGLNAITSDVTSQIGQYQKAQIIDIDSSSDDFSNLQKLSISSNYPSCLAPSFNQDSWIPSVSQTTIPCQVSSANATNATCTSTSDFQTRATGCVGCMDTYLILQGNTTKLDVSTSLGVRYPGCTTFNGQLSNTWENFYLVKQQTIGAVFSRSKTADTSIDQIITSIQNDIVPQFDKTLNDLLSEFSTITDPKFGLIAGFNCRVLGEDVVLLVNTFCDNVLVTTYFLQITFGVVGYLILFISCCSVCLGVRHLRKQEDEERKQKYMDDKGIYPGRQFSAQELYR